jgi:hypothetical protein
VGVRQQHTVSQANVNVWTHVAGVYDASAYQISLYVNGVLTGQSTVSSVIAAPGSFVVGGTVFNDGNTAFFHGSISDVQAYQTALTVRRSLRWPRRRRGRMDRSPPARTRCSPTRPTPPATPRGYQSYTFYSSADPSATCTSLTACFNNVSISPNSNLKLDNADGGNSFSAEDLTNAGWNSGGTVNVNGAKFTLPQFGVGQADNVLAANRSPPAGRSPWAGRGGTTPTAASSPAGSDTRRRGTTR